jgi:hypothetical protein
MWLFFDFPVLEEFNLAEAFFGFGQCSITPELPLARLGQNDIFIFDLPDHFYDFPILFHWLNEAVQGIQPACLW